MQLWHIADTLMTFGNLILLKVIQVVVVFGCLPIRKLLLKLVCIHIEFRNHLIDVLDVVLKTILRLLNPFVPQHGQKALNVRLGRQCVPQHF